MTEKDYRKEKRLSYSSVKDFDLDRIKFYKKHILFDQSEQTEMSTAMLLGSLIDCLLFSNETFDEKFHIANCIAPTGQIGDFTAELCSITLKSLNEDLVVTRDLTEMMEEAFKNVKYDRKGAEVKFKGKDFKWLVANFVGTEAESYYKECRSQFSKDVVDMNLINAANKIVEELKTCEWTKDIINATTTKDIEVLDQLIVLFEVGTEPFKAMLDRVIIDHKEKTIASYDLKVTYSGEDFQYNYWKMRYYLQVASYYLALMYYKKSRPDLEGYTVLPIEFIVGSSTLNSNPLIYTLTAVNVNEGLYGYITKAGNKYKGLYELIEDINWHKKNQLWRNSKEVYDNKGRMVIKPFE
jgi:hypothetical protein